ncbi:MAG: DNA recombination protein RmuC [bacterium]|nr:DNA recombination protein RmuC [bacterium]
MEIALIILGLVLVGSLVFNWVIFKRMSAPKDSGEYQVLHQRMDSVTQIILNQLKDNRESVENQLKESRASVERSSSAIHQQTQGFISGITQLQETVKGVHESVKGVVSFQNIFKSPKLRGQWGETSLEAVLGQYFAKDLYSTQFYFKSGEAVDAILKLPSGQILPIDSKFNWENFEKMTNADNDINRDIYKKSFISDVKKKIDEIASKYILPSEGTVDLGLMYVPAEGVFYEIVHQIKDVDISDYARKKKIILVSPNTLYLTLSAIQYWFRDVQITKQTQEIIKRLSKINQDATKLSDNFRRLGKHLSDAQGSFDDSEKRLDLMVSQVHRVIGEEEKEVASLPQEENMLN